MYARNASAETKAAWHHKAATRAHLNQDEHLASRERHLARLYERLHVIQRETRTLETHIAVEGARTAEYRASVREQYGFDANGSPTDDHA